MIEVKIYEMEFGKARDRTESPQSAGGMIEIAKLTLLKRRCGLGGIARPRPVFGGDAPKCLFNSWK
jgi:hypothetical protein